MRQINGRDAVFLYLGDDGSASTVLSCNVVENPDGQPLQITVEDIAAWAQVRIQISDLFRSKLVRLPGDFALPYWMRDADFDIGDHIEIHRSGRRDWGSVRAQLARLADAPLDLRRPPWKLHVIPDIEGFPDRDGLVSLVAFHCHHAAFDGMTLGLISTQMFGDERLIRPDEVVGEAVVSRAALIRRESARLPAVAYRFIRGAHTAFRDARQRPSDTPSVPDTAWPVTRFNGTFTGPRTADLVSLPRDEVLELKSRVEGVTVNDLMLSVIGEALAGYLASHGESPQASLSSLVPVATRSERPSNTLNQFTFMVANMHTDEPDRAVRLKNIAAGTKAEKARALAAHADRTDNAMVEVTPAPVLRLLAYLGRRSRRRRTAQTRAPFNTVVSNVRTPDIERKIFGWNIVNGFAIQPIATGTTLAHSVLNRQNMINISITVDGSVMPDTGDYCDRVRESFREHQKALS
ncbi:wax ester/triacylglycerol synthase domain-containing protein [Williamsia soli]|uniref:wax ester/triacylglycerol synthase domain-containing protein n=1 Tax=Williamsia soli TaxID=364929 RepID=UPI001A9F753B|nr:wax ester/triacylglycerol synthase domain-containing protein [Williamsia soli]